MHLGWNLPDHVAGSGSCCTTVKIHPLMGFERVLDPLFELTDLRGMHEELFRVQSLDEIALFHVVSVGDERLLAVFMAAVGWDLHQVVSLL